MFTDMKRLLRNVCGRYQAKTLTKALAEYDQAVSDSDPRDTASDIYSAIDMSLEEFVAIQEVTDDDRRSAQLALERYTKRSSVRALKNLVDPGEQHRVRLILERWVAEEARSKQAA